MSWLFDVDFGPMWISSSSYRSKVTSNVSLFIGKRYRRWLYLGNVKTKTRCAEQSWAFFGRFVRCNAHWCSYFGKIIVFFLSHLVRYSSNFEWDFSSNRKDYTPSSAFSIINFIFILEIQYNNSVFSIAIKKRF